MAVTKYNTTFVDAKGNKARFTFYVSADTAARANGYGFTGFLPLVDPLTNAQRLGTPGAYGSISLPGEYGTQATYGSIEDKLILTFVSAAGGISRWQIPAPKAAVFLTDQETVNVAQTDVAAFIAYALATGPNGEFICNSEGVALAACPGGMRIRRKNQRRLSIFTKNPAETGPAE